MNKFLAALFMTTTMFAQSNWTKADTIRESIVMGVIYVDWDQTREIQANPEKWEESNPLIGHQPGQVNRYFLASAMCHAGIAYILPPKARRI